MTATYVTVGHSNRTLEEFISLMRDADVVAVADVRKLRGSRAYPHFDEPELRAALTHAGIAYEAIERLSGRRPRNYDIAPETNGLWRNQSFHNYADYALTAAFTGGLDELIALGADHHETEKKETTKSVAVMCAEAVWWRCHRRIIADYLLARGERVMHLIGPGNMSQARLTDGAEVSEEARHEETRVTYPPITSPSHTATPDVKP